MPKRRRVAIMLDLDWPYERHAGVLTGTQRYAAEQGWECIVDEMAHETLAAASPRNPPYEGVIARANPQLAQQSRRCRIPVVNTWHNSPARDVPIVTRDFLAIGQMAAEHLLGLGLRRFNCIAVRKDRAALLQITGFQHAVDAAAGACHCTIVSAAWMRLVSVRQRFYRSLALRIADWKLPVGVFITMPDMASRCIATEISRHGLRIPQDVALIAGCDEPALCQHPAPSLTNIRVSSEEVGYQSAKLLHSLMDGQPAPTQPILVKPLRVAARQSTDFLAVEDELVAAAIQYLVTHIHKPLDVSEVAHAIHASRRTLERRFVAALGRTVAKEIRRLRLDRAKKSLLETDLPMKAIARSAGFANEQRMSEAFRSALGIAPTQFRSGCPSPSSPS